MQNQPYHPISCSYYDRLESLATRCQRCDVVYISDADRENQNLLGYIVDLYTKDQEEFMVMDTGLIIRLDHLVSVNGILNPSFSRDDNEASHLPHC